MNTLDIGEVSKRTGIPASTLRYYEEVGLIKSTGRRGLRRQFGPETLVQLSFIALGRSSGFSLQEISGMIGKDGKPNLSRTDFHKKAQEVDLEIKKMNVMRKTLRHIADCPARSHMECPTFRKLLQAAGRRKVLVNLPIKKNSFGAI
jgi:DNA-binding transcriptional MerR regulator